MLGAGDGFMSGLLKGWLTDQDWPTALTYANACGAFAVSRHGCTPAYPSWEELRFFLDRGIRTPALRKDAELEQIHWSTNRLRDWPEMRVFAFDHRMQLEKRRRRARAAAASASAPSSCSACRPPARSPPAAPATASSATAGSAATRSTPPPAPASGSAARSRTPAPARSASRSSPTTARRSPSGRSSTSSRCSASTTPTTTPEMKADQEATVVRLARAARANGLELLLEIIPSKVAPVTDTTAAEIIQRFYDLGVYPDWWKLEPMRSDAAWRAACAAITRNDPHTRGIVVLGLEAPTEELAASFAVAAGHDLVKGFAVGRTIFADAARGWLAGSVTDAEAVADMAERYDRLCRVWDEARARKGAAA